MSVVGGLVQAEDRAHRVGQKGTVLIRYLHAPGTCDDIMSALLAKKLKVVGQALDGNSFSSGESTESAQYTRGPLLAAQPQNGSVSNIDTYHY